MKKLFLILGFIAAIFALILAVTPLFKIAFIPCIAALLFGVLAMFISKNKPINKKAVQLMFLMTIIALALTTYKSIFSSSEVGNTEQLEEKEELLEEESIQDLEDIDIEEIDQE
ncbi:hypothetical protein [Psychroserpens sp. Hel_I_66]|uniref:hypothetical protein n=1 Tax=Psychroserpens sp. Hel_I_66 TaxID=1250004 RepID=UPI000646F0A0|nr:hypothetical protein [Psychroserpens sp. Hel_I_66]